MIHLHCLYNLGYFIAAIIIIIIKNSTDNIKYAFTLHLLDVTDLIISSIIIILLTLDCIYHLICNQQLVNPSRVHYHDVESTMI